MHAVCLFIFPVRNGVLRSYIVKCDGKKGKEKESLFSWKEGDEGRKEGRRRKRRRSNPFFVFCALFSSLPPSFITLLFFFMADLWIHDFLEHLVCWGLPGDAARDVKEDIWIYKNKPIIEIVAIYIYIYIY